MYPKLVEDRDRLPVLLQMASDYAASVFESLDSAPVAAPPSALAPATLSATGIGTEHALQLFNSSIAPGRQSQWRRPPGVV